MQPGQTKAVESPQRRTGHRAGRLALFLGLGLTAASSLVWARCGVAGCPDPRDLIPYQPGGAPVLLDRHGEELTSLHPLERQVVSLDSLPEHVPKAFVAVEDRRFYEHDGIDWIRVVGAALHNLRNPEEAQGASTITMQLARSVFPERIPGSERTLRRKLLEARVAKSIEHRFSKQVILELYLNHVYFGGGVHGIEAASAYYFDRPAPELTLAEAALLAALVQAPARYDPRRFPERALERRELVLLLMESQGLVPEATATQARNQSLVVTDERPAPGPPTPAPYFVEAVRLALEEALGSGAYARGLRVHTTLDPVAQAAVEEGMNNRLSEIEAGRYGRYTGAPFDPSTPAGVGGTDYLQGAMVVMESATGEVLAMVGGRDFGHSRFNRATLGRRPVGSAFKPFVYLAALREGFVASQPIADRPFRLVQTGTEPWSPRNYDGRHRGPVTMREALVQSLNVPTARLAMAVGIPAVIQAARDVGIRDSLPATPALALGTASLSPLELTSAYATLARLGRSVDPTLITRVEDPRGRILFEPHPSPVDAVDPRLAYLLTDMLSEVVDRGTGNAVRRQGFTGPAAGKTGTTQDATDAWFVGYTPNHVGTVWIGHDQPRPIFPGATGGRLAAPIWAAVMEKLEGDGSVERWDRPPGIVERSIDPQTGRIVSAGCNVGRRDAGVELFLEEFVPAEDCPRPQGFFSRLAGAVRGLFGGGGGGQEARRSPTGSQSLDGTEPAEVILGTELVPLVGR